MWRLQFNNLEKHLTLHAFSNRVPKKLGVIRLLSLFLNHPVQWKVWRLQFSNLEEIDPNFNVLCCILCGNTTKGNFYY